VSSEVRDEFSLTGRRIDERYEVERVVAAGGFGTVYYGHHRALQNPVAVKVLRVPANLTAAEQHEFAQHFLAEARTLAALRHPAVVRALDFGVSPMPNGVTAPWAALEWVEGETLKEFLAARADQPMAPREALALLRPVIEALADAHGLGVAHRDIKPANIMLPKAGTHALRSRVLDFGIAKTMDPSESTTTSGATNTRSNLSGFSVRCAAPEQVSGARTGPWTDVHALALVITETLVGRPPYEGEDFVDLAACAMRAERPTPARLGVDVGAWEPVLARAMAMKPPHRFANARELLAALDAVVPTESRPLALPSTPAALPVAPSPSDDTASPRPARRWPLALALLLLAAVALGAAALLGARGEVAAPVLPATADARVAPPLAADVHAAPPAPPRVAAPVEPIAAPPDVPAAPQPSPRAPRGARRAPREPRVRPE